MANITVATTGEQPLVLLSTNIDSNLANANISPTNVLSVICLQDVTITSSTGVYSWADFCSTSMNKLATPSDNEISMNVVIDPTTYFGANTANVNAYDQGLAGLSQRQEEVQFLIAWNYNQSVANVANGNVKNLTNVAWTSGKGFITNLAPTAGVEAPVWVTPVSIAVNGTMYNGYET
jgi:hypothetical protein